MQHVMGLLHLVELVCVVKLVHEVVANKVQVMKHWALDDKEMELQCWELQLSR